MQQSFPPTNEAPRPPVESHSRKFYEGCIFETIEVKGTSPSSVIQHREAIAAWKARNIGYRMVGKVISVQVAPFNTENRPWKVLVITFVKR